MLIAPELDNHLVSLDLSLKQMRNPSLVVGTVNQGSGGVDSEADDHSRSSSGAAPDRMVTNEVETVSCSPRGGGRGAGAEELAGGDGGQSLNDHFDGQGGGKYDVTRAEDVPADGGEPIPRQQQTSLPKVGCHEQLSRQYCVKFAWTWNHTRRPAGLVFPVYVHSLCGWKTCQCVLPLWSMCK